ncbi:DNA polymerase III subunit delta' [Rhodobacteraceae bacterium WD3A24]|nr:DNA polymerase III subunit delta' [Rhodobacteraceae bacterium WD3A24]
MSETDDLPEPDRVEGAPHPRATLELFGQGAAEAAFLDAFNAGRLHHGWLITGPRGVGKATLAWRIARFLLGQPAEGAPAPDSLDVPPDSSVARRVAALSEGGLFLLRRAWDEKAKRLKTVITVDEARRLRDFFGLSSAEGGRRVVIVDAADEMNPQAANAILKLLEEPPARAALLLISHQPSRLLPTIRSRCRELRLGPLDADDMAAALAAAGAAPASEDEAGALAALSQGSVGEAMRIARLDGLALYAAIVDLFATLPRLDRTRARALADQAAGKGAEARFDLTLRLLDVFLARLARSGVTGPPAPEAAPGEAALMSRLCPDRRAAREWAEQQQALGNRARQGRAVNLDPAALVLDMVLKLDATARKLAA